MPAETAMIHPVAVVLLALDPRHPEDSRPCVPPPRLRDWEHRRGNQSSQFPPLPSPRVGRYQYILTRRSGQELPRPRRLPPRWIYWTSMLLLQALAPTQALHFSHLVQIPVQLLTCSKIWRNLAYMASNLHQHQHRTMVSRGALPCRSAREIIII